MTTKSGPARVTPRAVTLSPLVVLVVLIAADVILALADTLPLTAVGIVLWGLHMGMTQGVLAALIAANAPVTLRGTAFGLFYLASGGAMLLASVLAGLVWDHFGAAATFYAGALFAAAAFILFSVGTFTRGKPHG